MGKSCMAGKVTNMQWEVCSGISDICPTFCMDTVVCPLI